MSKTTTDPIADMLSRIRNSLRVSAITVVLPHSKSKLQLLKLLKEGGFVEDVRVLKDKYQSIEVILTKPGEPSRITHLKRISKPGHRRYVKSSEIPQSKGGQGLVVVSTSQGLMAGHQARKRRLGGELICEVS